jgi:hypothetical protein
MKRKVSRRLLSVLLFAFLGAAFSFSVAASSGKVTTSIISSSSKTYTVSKKQQINGPFNDERFERRKLQLLPIGGGNPKNPSAAPFTPPTSTKSPPSPVATPVAAPVAAPVAQSQPQPQPQLNPTMRPSAAPVEQPHTYPVMRLVVTYVATQLQANPLTDQILQIIADSVLVTTFPTPQLVTITGYVPILDDVLARRRSLVNTQCGDESCDGDNTMYNYTITCACDYTDSVSDALVLLNEATAAIVNAVESGQLSDEIQNEAAETGEQACQSTQVIKATVECVTCNNMDTVVAIDNMLTAGEIAGICVGAVVFTSILFAFIAVYYNPHLLKGVNSQSNDNNEAVSSAEDIESHENPPSDGIPVTSCN